MRLISLVPAATGWLHALNAQKHLVGRSKDHLHPEVQALPVVSAKPEDLLALQPDFVISPTDISGVPVLMFSPETMKQTLDRVLKLGKVTGKFPEALKLVANLETTLLTKQKQRGINPKRPPQKPSVAYISSFSPLTIEKRWVLDVIEHAGGLVFSDEMGTKMPDVMLIGYAENALTQAQIAFHEWLTMQHFSAPISFFVPNALYLCPSPQLYEAIDDLMNKLSDLTLS